MLFLNLENAGIYLICLSFVKTGFLNKMEDYLNTDTVSIGRNDIVSSIVFNIVNSVDILNVFY